MLNFIKSEYYRMIHTTGIRVFFGILSVLTILLISGISIVETQYHTTSFSYSILGGTTIMPAARYEDMYIGKDDGPSQQSGI